MQKDANLAILGVFFIGFSGCKIWDPKRLHIYFIGIIQQSLCSYPIVKMEIRGLKVLKSKGLVFAQFCSKYDNSSSDCVQLVPKYY